MFKDVYKSAFNDINADPQLIAKILEKAQPRRNVYVYRYAFSACAAVIALAILIPSFFNGHNTTETVMMNTSLVTGKSIVADSPDTEIAPKTSVSPEETQRTASDVVSDYVDKPHTPEFSAAADALSESSSASPTYGTTKANPAVSAPPVSAQNSSNVSRQENTQAASESGSLKEVTEAVNQRSEEEAVKEPEKNPVMLSINKIEPVHLPDDVFYTYANSPKAGGGSGAVSRSLDSPNNVASMDFAAPEVHLPETVSMSASDYFKHIGFNPGKLDLPDGLIADYNNETEIQVEKQADAVQSDTATFTFSGDSFVSVTTSSDSAKVSSMISNDSYSKTQIGNNSVVITYDGSSYNGYFLTPEGSAVEITTVDLSEEEFTELIVSAVE